MGRRQVATGLVLVGAALIALGVLYRDWWSGEVYRGTTMSIGVTSMKGCADGECQTISLTEVVGSEHRAWTTVGTMLLYGGLAAAAALLLVGGLELARKRVRSPMAPTTAGFLLSGAVLLLGFLFVMLKPKGLHGTGLQAGLSFFIVAAGGIAGLLGSILVAKQHAAIDDAEWLAAATREQEVERAERPPSQGEPWS